MQFTIVINQARMLEWELNYSQAALLSFLIHVPSWADSVVGTGGRPFWRITKSKIISELPSLTGNKDTVYRHLKRLEKIGLIEICRIGNELSVRITQRGSLWNRTDDSLVSDSAPPDSGSSEKNPSCDNSGSEKNLTPTGDAKNFGDNSEKNPAGVGKKSGLGSEKNPTYQYTSNQYTNINNSNNSSPSSNGNFSAITPDWFPSADVIELIRQSNPDVSDAEITEVRNSFVVYWLDRGEKRPSFDSLFYRRFKVGLAELRRAPAVGRSTRDVPLGERLTDRSWAGRSTRDVSLTENLTDRSWADGG